MAREPLVHKMEKTIRVPNQGEPYWQTVCGIKLGGDQKPVTTAHDPKQVTCGKCSKG